MKCLRNVEHHLEWQLLLKPPAWASTTAGYRWGDFADKGLLQSKKSSAQKVTQIQLGRKRWPDVWVARTWDSEIVRENERENTWAKLPGKKRNMMGAADCPIILGVWNQANGTCDWIGGGQNYLQGLLDLFSHSCRPQTYTIAQWDFELCLAREVARWTSQEDRSNGRDLLPALIVRGSLHPNQIFQVSLGFVCPHPHTPSHCPPILERCLLACAWNIPNFINRFRKLLHVTNLVYLEMQTRRDWCGFSCKYFSYLCPPLQQQEDLRIRWCQTSCRTVYPVVCVNGVEDHVSLFRSPTQFKVWNIIQSSSFF